MSQGLFTIALPGYEKVVSGKVREVFSLGEQLLFVATDRISAFDCIMPQAIPGKGKVLTRISEFWFQQLAEVVPHHLISADPADLPANLKPFTELLRDRFLIVRRLRMIPIECVVRGYLAGSAYVEYSQRGTVCGMALPPGLQNAEVLPQPIFTPAAKAATGHDENIDFAEMARRVGTDLACRLRELSLEIYRRASLHAAERGILIADTKFEFGLSGTEIVLADEVLTPDSSRYWPRDTYQPGRNPPSFDKQFLRDYLESTDWDKNPPAPNLPEQVVEGTKRRYEACLELLTR
jgi:phosphoribosylaminoimidazole-succinocarboxamide synthase